MIINQLEPGLREGGRVKRLNLAGQSVKKGGRKERKKVRKY